MTNSEKKCNFCNMLLDKEQGVWHVNTYYQKYDGHVELPLCIPCFLKTFHPETMVKDE